MSIQKKSTYIRRDSQDIRDVRDRCVVFFAVCVVFSLPTACHAMVTGALVLNLRIYLASVGKTLSNGNVGQVI